MGLVGFGGTARAVASRAAALGMRVIAHDDAVDPADPAWSMTRPHPFDTVLREADVLSLHVPLTDQTRMMIDTDALAAMKPGAILVNAARGGIVDEAALAVALRAGHLGGAALDVFETEPLTATAAAPFADVPNLLLTPHIAGITHESNVAVSNLTATNVLKALAA
jgi:(S)-sulfolactate dehydrogenase